MGNKKIKKAITIEITTDMSPKGEMISEMVATAHCPVCGEQIRDLYHYPADHTRDQVSYAKRILRKAIEQFLLRHLYAVHMEDTVCPHCKSTDVTRHDLSEYKEGLMSVADHYARYWVSCDNCRRIGDAKPSMTDAIEAFKAKQ